MNAYSLVNRVSRRRPGYTQYEYLDEINAAYKEVWDYITQLDDSYFTEIQQVTVASGSATIFDYLWNANGALTASLSPRYFQIDRIRIQQPSDSNLIPADPRPWNDPQLLAISQNTQGGQAISAPYLYTLFGRGSAQWAQPFPVGTVMELTYTFIFEPLVILSAGSVSSSGTVVTGSSTTFTQLLNPDYQGSLPGDGGDTDIGVELVIGSGSPFTQTGNQVYRVKTIPSDTSLTTFTAIAPTVSNSLYNLCSVPDSPEAHHNVIATIATRNFMSTPSGDGRFSQWAQLAEIEKNAMRDSVMQRQRQQPPQRRRFPFSMSRYFVYPSTAR